jgi:hypothetical protein
MGGGTTIYQEINTSNKPLFISILKFYRRRLKDMRKCRYATNNPHL